MTSFSDEGRRVLFSQVTDLGRVDERVACFVSLCGSTVGVNADSLDWCPDDLPPTGLETAAWMWLCRPDLFELLRSAAPDPLRDLMNHYDKDKLSEWWAVQCGNG